MSRADAAIRVAPLAACALLLAGCASPQLPRFEAVLAAHDSATQALGEWCAAQGIARPATIRALADRGAAFAATPAIRQSLGVGADEALAYRHVRLTCGNTVLSDARNWYVPARLTAEMNRTLETTDTPFGKVVMPLGFRRERLAQRRGRMAECPAATVLSHRALLRVPTGQAISLVVECYTDNNLMKRRG
ncbi:hypothetical protein [Novosphingobium sp. FKTRR1]|uniref:hypothetical protein n=1 Tax=Novosphingobium sp. FKTRR1 TaxID=2879118 RepID=UPI001CF040CB|nr:hypothetical protein [Novosphingobium sp. FKTRR1]